MRKSTITIVSVAVLCLVGLIILGPGSAYFYGSPLPFAAIQDLGGIRALSASRSPSGSVELYLHCNLSGLETVTTTPRTVAHLGGVGSIDATVEGNRVYVTINRTVSGSASAPPIDIGAISPGTYEILYRSPGTPDVAIGSVEVP